ncbi:Kunitz inhibitor ST1-like [Vigna unguiculata]|uniref:Kunitz inhibitor ST1-like n=1 Tax=Vigna unguiculata TaxID=3917 RepID=A0A4D6M380_VIGUN|nr:Kunitz inhibitor ST1-like [Vigna unguiculata]
MKMTLVALVLVVALSTKALLGEAGPAPDQVVDTSGKKVRAGENYYIVPASSDIGGLALSTTGQDCPLDVVAVDGYQGQQLSLSLIHIFSSKYNTMLVSVTFTYKSIAPVSYTHLLVEIQYNVSLGDFYL